MAVVGIGVDILTTSRLVSLYKRFGRALAVKLLNQEELLVMDHLADKHKSLFLAKAFAAKEAVSKALGTGIGKISWREIVIGRLSSGAPSVRLVGQAAKRSQELGITHHHLTLSDERQLIVAMCCLEAR